MTEDDLSGPTRRTRAACEIGTDRVRSHGGGEHSEPSDPELQRRYRLYKPLEAALALPAGPKRLEALLKAYRELRAN